MVESFAGVIGSGWIERCINIIERRTVLLIYKKIGLL